MDYNDIGTFYKVSPQGYGNNKDLEDSASVNGIFLQNTGFLHSSNQDAVEADASFYPDPEDEFVIGNYNRLEGMYIVVSPYEAPALISWYRITSVSVNRDHLLTNTIDNIELTLKKVTMPKLIS